MLDGYEEYTGETLSNDQITELTLAQSNLSDIMSGVSSWFNSSYSYSSDDIDPTSSTDALALTNVLKSLSIIDSINELRATDDNYAGYEDCLTNFVMMVGSAYTADVSIYQVAHVSRYSMFSSNENLAWGYSNPSSGWYTEEKELFDACRDELGYDVSDGEGLTSSEISAVKRLASSYGYTIGHYTNLMYSSTQLVGVGYTTTKYLYRTTSSSNAASLSRYTASYTTDEMRAFITAYQEYLESYEDSRIIAAEELIAAYETAIEAITNASYSNDITSAMEEILEQTDGLSDLTSTAAEALAAYKKAASALEAAQEEAESEYAAYSEIAEEYAALLEKIASLEKSLAEYEEAYEILIAEKDEAVSEAENAYEEADAAYNEAADALEEAESAYEAAKEVYEDASDACTKTEEAMYAAYAVYCAAETALEEAYEALGDTDDAAYEAAYEAYNDALNALAEAETVLADLEAAAEEAEEAYEAAQAALEKANALTTETVVSGEFDNDTYSTLTEYAKELASAKEAYETAYAELVKAKEIYDTASSEYAAAQEEYDSAYSAYTAAVTAYNEYMETTGHSFGEGVVTKEATCTEEGEITYTCTVCGDTYTETINAAGHSYEAVYTAATCTEDAYTAYTCTECGDSYVVTEEGSAAGHTAGEAVIENNVEATSTEDGSYDSVVYCIVCGTEISRETVTVTVSTDEKESLNSGETCVSVDAAIYTGSAQTSPEITVEHNGAALTEGTDYIVTYASECIDAGKYTVTITGIGNYTGTADGVFLIEAQELISSNISLSNTSYTYNGTARKPSVTVTDSTGTTLTKGTDYTVSYSNNTDAGTATVTITGTGNYTGTVKKTFTITAKSISSASITLSSTSYTYDGTAKKPSVKSVVLNGTTLSSSDYTVKYASGRKSIGAYKVRITGTGNYTGTTTVTFTIKPAKVTISSAKSSAANKLTVKWSKVSGSVTGYQVRYKKSTSSTWTTVTVKASTLSKTISSLTAGKKYNVQVRAYKTVDGTKYYGSWSSTKSVTVKKAQTLTVKSSSSKTVSYSKVKKAKQAVTAISKVSGAKGTVTYTKSSGKSYFTVNKKTGKITVKKGTPKGTYTVKIKVTSAATSTYASTSKTVTVKIKVK